MVIENSYWKHTAKLYTAKMYKLAQYNTMKDLYSTIAAVQYKTIKETNFLAKQ